MKKALIILLALCLCLGIMVGCGDTSSGNSEGDLAGKSLLVFSGAGISEPVTKLIDTFKAQTGCDVQTVFAATGNLISQIQTSEEGDILFAGSKDELSTLKEGEVTAVMDVVKHIPVLAVHKGNPKNIQSIADIGKEGIKVLIANPEIAPIGKIAVKLFKEADIYDKINIEASVTTAILAVNGVAQNEADVAIVWKENSAGNENVQIIDVPEMAANIKIVPAASLKYSANEEARKAFLDFLATDEAMAIWGEFGYEPANDK